MTSSNLSDFLDPEAINRLRNPDLSLAKGLPASIYTDPDFFALEQERLFPDVWVGIGFESDVPNVGDAVPVEVGGSPLILCRDKSSQIQVLHNVCLLYTSPSPRDLSTSRMPSSA